MNRERSPPATNLSFSGASANIRRIAAEAAFGKALITNSYRGLVAEAIIASALEPVWQWCAADWAGWDFERSGGLRLEVRQSAALQTWRRSGDRPSICSFDIRARKGRYEGADWFDEPGRYAHIYIFAYHPVLDEGADHCDPQQWQFFVVPTADLPSTKRMGLRTLTKLAEPRAYHELAVAVDKCATRVKAQRPMIRAIPTAG